MSKNRYYSKVRKIQEAFTAEVASKCIEEGWELISIRDYTQREFVGNLPVITTRPVYILAYMDARE